MSHDIGRSRTKDYLKKDIAGNQYADYKCVDDLRRAMTPNGKIHSRKRLSTTARQQRLIAQAIKRSRFMALLPFTSGTL
jgi:small subunit ribosomal protein S18